MIFHGIQKQRTLKTANQSAVKTTQCWYFNNNLACTAVAMS